MASSALNRFPAEIVRTILADVPNADFPAARLLGKNFANIATPRLFSSIPLWISLKSLENLTNIASHAQLRLYVKEIVFSPLRVIEHEDESEYFSGIEEALEYEPDPANAVALRIGEHMASYHGYIGAQEYLAKGLSILHHETIRGILSRKACLNGTIISNVATHTSECASVYLA